MIPARVSLPGPPRRSLPSSDRDLDMTAVPHHTVPRLAALLALCLSAACHHDSSTAPPTTTSDVVKVTPDSATNLQVAVVGHTIHVTVIATNPNGSPASGQNAVWRISTGNGSISSTSTTTDANGKTGVEWTLGTVSGANVLVVSVGTGVTTVTATGAPDSLRVLNKVSADSQHVVPAASMPLVVRAVDRFGNPVAGVVVTWTSTGGTIAPISTTTGNGGNAQVTFTADTIPAVYTITATTTGLAPVVFTLTGG